MSPHTRSLESLLEEMMNTTFRLGFAHMEIKGKGIKNNF